jgi:hypothetical protein
LGFWDGRTAAVVHFGVNAFEENEQTKLARAGVDFFFLSFKNISIIFTCGERFLLIATKLSF